MREAPRRIPARSAPARLARRRRPYGRAALAVLCLGTGLGTGTVSAASGTQITDVRTWSAPERTRIVLDLDGKSTYKVWRSASPPHLTIEVHAALGASGRAAVPKADKRVKDVKMEQAGGVTRIAVSLPRPLQYKHFALAPYGPHKPHRIVVDVYDRPATVSRSAPRPAPPARAASASRAGRPFVVIVDPGHGGEDPGAVGRYYRTREKDVVLQIGRRLKREIDALPGMRAELTRRGDYFVSLGGRVRKADALHGDLFVSIHADTSRDRHTRGTHVYTLAPRSARDRRAVRVAKMENASDLMGGVDAAARLPMIFDGDGSPNNTVESRVLARMALGRLREVNRDGREGRRSEARFWVLKGNRPSLLVETAFLSNRDDERNLRAAAFQQQLAHDLAMSIRDYVETRVRGGSIVHTVKNGETLSHIAARYGVGIGDLTEANRIARNGILRTGDRLVVPRQAWPGYGAPAAAPAPRPLVRKVAYTRPEPAGGAAGGVSGFLANVPAAGTHRVRSGENLTLIARRYGVRLADLMRFNGLNRGSPLIVGRRLKVPPTRPGDLLHTVRRGETLSGLAASHAIPLSAVAAANDLRPTARLRVGQRLILPGARPRVPATPRATPAAARVPSRSAPMHHTVGRGETLSGLATRYGVDQGDLARANGLGLWARLKVGQRLTIPGAAPPAPTRKITVTRGQTLSGLAQRYRVSQAELARMNGLRTGARLLVGQRLTVPGGAGGPMVHVVRPGDSLTRIARAYDVSVGALQRTNALRDADRLAVGASLVIPR
jgi:N-acetylmuramoyl-L-alanine amidase